MYGENERAWCFVCSSGIAPTAGLVLHYSKERLKVVNIVPRETSELTIPEYNAILDEFANAVKPNVPASLEMHYSKGERSLTDFTTQEAFEALRRFSRTANRSAGTAHPNDQERWFEFVLTQHRSGRELPSDILERWLVEEEGWSREKAFDLSAEYEKEIALLRHVDRT
jgi:hypothetical protein